MKKRYLALLLPALVGLAVLSGCQENTAISSTGDRIAEIDQEETYPDVPGTLAVVYGDLAELTDDASLIVKGTVTEQEVQRPEGLPQTHTTLKVQSVWKGELSPDSQIEVVEEGGGSGTVLGNIPQMSPDYSYYLMLREEDGTYYICGAFQGRFVEREGYVFQQAIEGVKLEEYAPLPAASFEETIQSLVEGQ